MLTNARDKVDEKLDCFLDRATSSSNSQMLHDKLNVVIERLDCAHGKLDMLLEHDNDTTTTQMENERVEGREMEGMNHEKNDLAHVISEMRSERDGLYKRTSEAREELCSLETMLALRYEEIESMKDRAEKFEKRILLSRARSVQPATSIPGMNLKRLRTRENSVSSATGAVPSNPTPSSMVASNARKERSSVSNVAGNRDAAFDRSLGFESVKQCHSADVNSALRSASWSCASSFDYYNKENQSVAEDDEGDGQAAPNIMMSE